MERDTLAVTADRADGLAPPVSEGARYSQVAIVLHWSTALLVVSTIPLGLYGAAFETLAGQAATNIHKLIGIFILVLSLARVGWRLGHRPPRLPQNDPPALRLLAKTTHSLFYGLLIILPLSGWWMSSAVPTERHPIGFDYLSVPFLPVPRGWASAGPAHMIHVNLAFLMIGLALLHILAALKHQFIDKDNILARMLPPQPWFENKRSK